MILGKAAVATELGEGAVHHPAPRQHHEGLHVVGSLNDLDAQAPRPARHGLGDLARVVSPVCLPQFEPVEALTDRVQHAHSTVTILDVGRVDHDQQRRAFGIDQGVRVCATSPSCWRRNPLRHLHPALRSLTAPTCSHVGTCGRCCRPSIAAVTGRMVGSAADSRSAAGRTAHSSLRKYPSYSDARLL